MRWLAVVLVAALMGGCPLASKASLDNGGDDFNPEDPGPSRGYCGSDEDCLAVGGSCCECPTFAVSHNDPFSLACEDVVCPPRTDCAANLVAKCVVPEHKCDLRCRELSCNVACAGGFASDANGCLTCACAQAPANGCLVDTDCVRVRDDCCGCALGGFDTAVLKTQQAQHEAQLMCSATPSCPGVDTCIAGAVPRCLQGSCVLFAGGLPSNACGRPDLPPCPSGSECVLNSSDSANVHGVGVCAATP
ncbi:MAG: hypothetical protein KIT31_36915 [Deltaproteobacteria bacterium]|nr:hypothetical protein [Deltaproteobacteria bacterium]